MIKQKDFRVFHLFIVIFYLAAFINGLSGKFVYSLRQFHPFIGLSIIFFPGIFFLLNKNKRIIRNFIKANFSLSGNAYIKIAKISTVLIIMDIGIMIITGVFLLTYVFPNHYKIYYDIHRSVIYVLPVISVAHIASRKISKI